MVGAKEEVGNGDLDARGPGPCRDPLSSPSAWPVASRTPRAPQIRPLTQHRASARPLPLPRNESVPKHPFVTSPPASILYYPPSNPSAVPFTTCRSTVTPVPQQPRNKDTTPHHGCSPATCSVPTLSSPGAGVALPARRAPAAASAAAAGGTPSSGRTEAVPGTVRRADTQVTATSSTTQGRWEGSGSGRNT